ncbi:MAG TPA: DUF433 domain-containing protein [Tepidisphaeraceae bacterium]|jgi:uncharacterized protein (DUF433 family)
MTVDQDLLRRITADATIFGGKPIIRGRRLAVEHVLAMLAAGDAPQDVLAAYPFLDLTTSAPAPSRVVGGIHSDCRAVARADPSALSCRPRPVR